MVVPGDHELRAGRVQGIPQRPRLLLAAVAAARAEPRMVPVGERAALAGPGEVRPQPLLLSRPGLHADIAVERDDVPAAHIVTVVPRPPPACVGTKVVVVARGA